MMQIMYDHDWQVDVSCAKDLQRQLSHRLIICPFENELRYVAAVDVSYHRQAKMGFAVVGLFKVQWDSVTGKYQLLGEEYLQYCGAVNFPYIPGYLSFREIPLLLPILKQVKSSPDIILVDGAGVAHPRGFGIASHLGVILDRPTVGCAKSRLCGVYQEPAAEAGSSTDLMLNGAKIGTVLRSRSDVHPLFISPGHRCDYASACGIIYSFCEQYRIPEPIRRVDRISKELRQVYMTKEEDYHEKTLS